MAFYPTLKMETITKTETESAIALLKNMDASLARIAKRMDSIVDRTHAFAKRMDSIADRTHAFTKQMDSIADRTHALTKQMDALNGKMSTYEYEPMPVQLPVYDCPGETYVTSSTDEAVICNHVVPNLECMPNLVQLTLNQCFHENPEFQHVLLPTVKRLSFRWENYDDDADEDCNLREAKPPVVNAIDACPNIEDLIIHHFGREGDMVPSKVCKLLDDRCNISNLQRLTLKGTVELTNGDSVSFNSCPPYELEELENWCNESNVELILM